MKLFKTLAIAFIFLSSISVYASQADYNEGRNFIIKLKEQNNNYASLYRNYLESVKKCSHISGDIYHAGDPRINDKPLCHKLLGMHDEYHNKNSPLSKCDRTDVPDDITYPSNLSVSECIASESLTTASICGTKQFTGKLGDSSLTFNFPEGDTYGSKRTVFAEENGNSCGENAVVSCSVTSICSSTSGEWEHSSEKCDCISNEASSEIKKENDKKGFACEAETVDYCYEEFNLEKANDGETKTLSVNRSSGQAPCSTGSSLSGRYMYACINNQWTAYSEEKACKCS